MPWCEECQKYRTPTSLTPDGRCPACGADVGAAARDADAIVDEEKAPWHFKLLVVAVVAYLGWRLVQLVTGQL